MLTSVDGDVQTALFRMPGDHVLTMHPRYRNARGELSRPSGSCPCGWISTRRPETADDIGVEFRLHVKAAMP